MGALVFASVARASDAVVLAQYSTVSGDLVPVATECYRSFKHGEEDRYTIMCDGYSFNFVVHRGYVFTVVALEALGREIPYACAKRICDAWTNDLTKGHPAAVLARSFSHVLKREMEYCELNPEEVSKTVALQQKVDEVKGIMIANLEEVMLRSEKLDGLRVRSEDIEHQASIFKKKGQELRNRMWYTSCKAKACLVLVVCIAIAALVSMGICLSGHTRCFGGGRSNMVVQGANGSSSGSNGGSSDGSGSSGSGGGATNVSSPLGAPGSDPGDPALTSSGGRPGQLTNDDSSASAPATDAALIQQATNMMRVGGDEERMSNANLGGSSNQPLGR